MSAFDEDPNFTGQPVSPAQTESGSSNPYDSVYGKSVAPAINKSSSAEQAEESTFMKAVDKFNNTIGSYANAAAIGVEHGINSVMSTVQKAITPYTSKFFNKLGVPMKYLETPESAQAYYNNLLNDYNTNPDAVKHNLVAGAGNIVGSSLPLAPLASMGPAAGTLMKGAMADTGAGTIAQSIASGAGNLLGNIAGGGIAGGMINSPEQGTNVWNQQGAKQGAIIGAVLTPVQMLVDAGLNSATKYDNYSQQLKQKYNYTGPVFSTDVPGQGITNDVREWAVNNAVSKIPLVNDLPGVGINSAREAQLTGTANAIKSYVQGLSDSMPDGSIRQFQNAIQAAVTNKNQTINTLSNNFRNVLDAAGVDSIHLPNSTPIINDLLKNDSGVLINTLKGDFNSLTNDGKSLLSNTSIDDLLGSKNESGNFVAGLKQKVWNEYERLSSDATNTPAMNASQKLFNLYHSLNEDVEQQVRDIPSAAAAFHDFNTQTSALQTLWDKNNSPELAKAAASINADQKGMMSLFNALKGKNLSPDQAQKYSSIIGQPGMQAVQNDVLQNMFKSSFQGDSFNVSKFLDQLNNIPAGSAKAVIMQPTVDALQGLNQFAQKALQSGAGQAITNKELVGQLASQTATAGALGYAAMSHPVIAGLLGSAQALGTIVAHPPLKNALIMLNKGLSSAGLPEQFATYLMNQASKQMINAGVILKADQSGNVRIQKQDESDPYQFSINTPIQTMGVRD